MKKKTKTQQRKHFLTREALERKTVNADSLGVFLKVSARTVRRYAKYGGMPKHAYGLYPLLAAARWFDEKFQYEPFREDRLEEKYLSPEDRRQT